MSYITGYGDVRNRVLEAVQQGNLTSFEVSEALPDVDLDTIRRNLARLYRSGEIRRVHRGMYEPISSGAAGV